MQFGGLMKPISDLVKKYGSTYKLAAAMGTSQPQVMRWVKSGALVSELTGEVYILTKTVNYPL
jgi:hypothetical protein